MRVALFLPLVSSWLALFTTLPCRAGWGGPVGGGMSTNGGMAAPAAIGGGNFGVRGNSAPAGANAANFNRGNGVSALGSVGGGYRAPGLATGGTPGAVRYAPITAGARPVGTVVTPRWGNLPPPVPRVVRPNVPVAGTPASGFRPYVPVVTNNTTARRGVTFPNIPAFGSVSRESNNRVGFQNRPDRLRSYPRAYLSNYQSPSPGWPRAGHYVPGECYVQDPTTSVYFNSPAFGPSLYLGGAFPYFYGGSPTVNGGSLGAGTDALVQNIPIAPVLPAPGPETPDPATPPQPDRGPARMEPAPAREPAGGGMNSLVEAVQAELLQRGYFGGRPDGVFAADTAEALRRFQENHGLARTGLINEATLFALGLN